MNHSILKINNSDYIAYNKFAGDKNKPIILFLGGFHSDMEGSKALFLEKLCINNNYGFIRFDYFGHGKSSKGFTECNISIWKQNCLSIIENLTDNRNLIIIGSSMGGWLMILVALEYESRIKALIGIASAPDFTEDLILKNLSKKQRKELFENGIFSLESEYSEEPYLITKELIEDGRNNLVLENEIDIKCPIRLLHGKADCDVPTSCSIKLYEQLISSDMKVRLLDNADHRMSSDSALGVLKETLLELLQVVE